MTVTWALGSTPAGGFIKRIKYPKAPTDTMPVTLDFAGALAPIDGDSLLASPTPTILIQRNDGGGADLIASSGPTLSADLTRITLWLSGGTAGFEYLVSLTGVSLNAQTLTRSFILPVYLR